ncbi:MAG: exodeoxyribonuclease VII small subunit [Lachnospiraceae bacterium]|nr:exodeoxyribonuclease VII small subunit [Lachnospiraceae bacterium]
MGENRQELTLEEAFEKLEETVEKLEAEEITLEESFQIYQQGMKILKYCNDKIDRVEKRVLRINEDGDIDEF